MRRVMFSIRRLHGRSTAPLAGMVLVLAGAGLAVLAAPAHAATSGQAAAGALPQPVPIRVNKANWSGKAGFGSRAPAWYKDASGVVHLQGALTQANGSGSGASRLGTLPRAARPARNVFTIVHTYLGTFADLEVARNGNLNLIDPRPPAVEDYHFVSLEGITYRPSGRVRPIPLDPRAWQPAAFGARAPAWYKDRSGIVHLQGAISPGGSPCTGTCFAGLLPKTARPNRPITTLVHTYLGTYGKLEILTDGEIIVQSPPPPLIADYAFVSLEGVTFRPSGPINPMDLNTLNWQAVLGDPQDLPAWFTDRGGIVYLQGAALQINNIGPGASLIGILPPAARPANNVFTIVNTDFGAYADLEIARNGDLNLISPRPPATNADDLVSLEGISYRR